MHDKYAYEKMQMALHDTDVHRFMAFGMAGLSVHGRFALRDQVCQGASRIRDETTGIITDFEIEGEFPSYGNDDDRVDSIASSRLARSSTRSSSSTPLYRGANSHAVGTDHHLQRGVRQKDRRHARTAARRASPSRPAPTPCTAGRRTARWPRSTRWRSSAMTIAATASPTPSPSLPGALGKAERRARRTTWLRILDGYFGQNGPPPERKRAQPRDADGRRMSIPESTPT